MKYITVFNATIVPRRAVQSVLIFLFIFPSNHLSAQPSSPYTWPEDELVKQKLENWQDQKFGIIIHWGLYSVPGIVESWPLCSEDWIERDSTRSHDDFKKWYWSLQKDFNPVKFDPAQWAKAAKGAGMRYLVFTTKHHDGFCMFDTRKTNFSIANGPFKDNPKKDIARYVFDAFRKENFMIGAYFSKPDWHSEYYWWPKYATADRNNNYDIRKYPWRWEQFKQFTSAQIGELMNNYGTVDILWLDGGWVRPKETVNDEVIAWGARIPEWSQDIDMPKIAAMARRSQPGLLIVDRTVHGVYENYRTPEQRIPNEKLDYPWESCMTLANNWGYVPNDEYKSSAKIIHALIEIVAKGGNLLLGIGPKPDGTFTQEALQRMSEIGEWLGKNGAALYGTRTVKNYQDSTVFFTQNKKQGLYYALALLDENKPLSASIEWKGNTPKKGTKMILLQTGESVRWTSTDNIVRVDLPSSLTKLQKKLPAITFSFTLSE